MNKNQEVQEIEKLAEMLSKTSEDPKSKTDFLFLKKKLSKLMNAIDQMENVEEDEKKKVEEAEKIKEYKENVIKSLENQISEAKSTFKTNLDSALKEFDKSLDETFEKIKSMKIDFKNETMQSQKKNRLFSEKSFDHKDSVLTSLFRSKEEFKTLYHIALASMILLMINLVFQDYIELGTFFDFDTLVWCFLNYDVVFKAWLGMITYAFLIIVIVKKIVQWNINKKIWIPLYVVFQTSLYIYATIVTYKYELNFGSAMIVLCECARLSMKTHSYLRNKLLYGVKNNFYATFIPQEAIKKGMTIDDINAPNITISNFTEEIKRFSYFLMCPTLVYRDEYPKRARRNLNFILFNGFNCFLCIYYAFILFKTFMKPQFSGVGKKGQETFSIFLLSIFKSILPGTFCLFLMFYGLLHSWFNMWAEIFRFPDRMFYEDWWNSLEFGTYYRKWNIVVHEFLFFYVYIDLTKFSKAVIHEWILTYAIGFFYPMLFIIFTGPGIILIRNSRASKSKQLNIFFWIMMFIGTGLLLVLYSREYYARALVDAQIVRRHYGWFELFMPRSLFVLLHEVN